MLRDVPKQAIAMMVGNSFERKVCNSIWDRWEGWCFSNGHADPPPDFYCVDSKMMIDVMRINDNEHRKSYNPAMIKERKIERELKEKGIDASKLFLNVDTGVSKDDFHSYNKYIKMANRVFQKHIESIPLYRKNHPGYKLGYLIFDESAQYIESINSLEKQKSYITGQCCGYPHIPIIDKNLMQRLIKSDVDFLIWFNPYKYFEGRMEQINPVFIQDTRFPEIIKLKDYDEEVMVCAEK